ncbi:hypothetical protein K1719_039149 [Acacia pycnantha]|nr:hypothetical protein K1719_039149 [Acacia pycnantha]
MATRESERGRKHGPESGGSEGSGGGDGGGDGGRVSDKGIEGATGRSFAFGCLDEKRKNAGVNPNVSSVKHQSGHQRFPTEKNS